MSETLSLSSTSIMLTGGRAGRTFDDMRSVSDIFNELGGPTAIARKLECGLSTATEMKRRRSIPVRYWRKLIEMSAGKLNPEILMLINAHEREAADDAA